MSDTQSEDFQTQAAPAEEHQRLEPFAGTFRAEVKMWMGPGEPQVMTGRMVNRFDLGGRFLAQEYRGDAQEGPFPDFEGRGYWGYNKVTGRYEGFWIDTASTIMQTEAGEVDETGRVWTMEGTLPDPKTGQELTKRSVITLEDENHHKMEMFFDTPDGPVKGMEIQYTRTD